MFVWLAAASAAHHLNGSRYGTWEHYADRTAMFGTLNAIAVIAVHSLLCATQRRPSSPDSRLDTFLNAAALCATGLGLLENRQAISTLFCLGLPGLIAAVAAFVATLLRTAPRPNFNNTLLNIKDGEVSIPSRADALAYSAEVAAGILFLFICANTVNSRFWGRLKREISFSAFLSDEERATMQAATDWAHGAWHHQSAFALAALARICIECMADSDRGHGPLLGRRARSGRGRTDARAVLLLWTGGGGVCALVLASAQAAPIAWKAHAALFAAAAAALSLTLARTQADAWRRPSATGAVELAEVDEAGQSALSEAGQSENSLK
mmetsp:Transcript_31389/g.78500  ORF Transcript_31389/g.78500 Transcript_31389/m.78500 type:complete len:324 (+) Transcript_31389:306-1277(+)